jgi:hypothetical protein
MVFSISQLANRSHRPRYSGQFGSDGRLEVVPISDDERRDGFMDLTAMQFRAPVFPVPSEVIRPRAASPSVPTIQSGTILVRCAA